jgi:uncharacterized protein (DUF1697 family)
MTCRVALLRGINVGSSKRMAMADLRAVMAALGYRDAETLLQSGNVVYRSSDSAKQSARRIRERLLADLGMDVPVVVRTAAELSSVVEAKPAAHAGHRCQAIPRRVPLRAARPRAGEGA